VDWNGTEESIPNKLRWFCLKKIAAMVYSKLTANTPIVPKKAYAVD
jgi:hypothetical protein